MALLKVGVLGAALTVLVAFAAVVVLGDAPAPAAVMAARNVTVKVRHGSLGNYLVDATGRSLYLFEKDRGTRSTCYGNCAALWPPLIAGAHVIRGPGVSAAKLGTVRRRGGAREITFSGHPLYYYAGDSRAGQFRGEGLNSFGAKWHIVSPRR